MVGKGQREARPQLRTSCSETGHWNVMELKGPRTVKSKTLISKSSSLRDSTAPGGTGLERGCWQLNHRPGCRDQELQVRNTGSR